MGRRTVAEKMGIAAGTRSYIIHPPPDALDAIGLPRVELVEDGQNQVDYIHLFVTTRDELNQELPGLKALLSARGALWVSWPKARKLGTDLTLQLVIEVGYSHGFVEFTVVRINDTWSAIKFTHPKPGKTYHNKYGTLPGP